MSFDQVAQQAVMELEELAGVLRTLAIATTPESPITWSTHARSSRGTTGSGSKVRSRITAWALSRTGSAEGLWSLAALRHYHQ